jgi:uncharacterized membrane protein
MSTLMIFDFADQGRAQAAYERIQELDRAALLTLVGAALLTVDTAGQVIMTKASYGKADRTRVVQSAAFGLILGSLALAPVLGFAAGGVIGTIFTAHEERDGSVDARFRKRVTDMMKPGHWVLAVYAVEVAVDEFAQQLDSFGGTRLVAALSPADDTALAQVLGADG